MYIILLLLLRGVRQCIICCLDCIIYFTYCIFPVQFTLPDSYISWPAHWIKLVFINPIMTHGKSLLKLLFVNYMYVLDCDYTAASSCAWSTFSSAEVNCLAIRLKLPHAPKHCDWFLLTERERHADVTGYVWGFIPQQTPKIFIQLEACGKILSCPLV